MTLSAEISRECLCYVWFSNLLSCRVVWICWPSVNKVTILESLACSIFSLLALVCCHSVFETLFFMVSALGMLFVFSFTANRSWDHSWLLANTSEDVPPSRTAYGSARAGEREIGYTRERGYDDRTTRGGWRDGDGLGGAGDLVRVCSTFYEFPHLTLDLKMLILARGYVQGSSVFLLLLWAFQVKCIFQEHNASLTYPHLLNILQFELSVEYCPLAMRLCDETLTNIFVPPRTRDLIRCRDCPYICTHFSAKQAVVGHLTLFTPC